MSNTVLKFILYDAAYINCLYTAGFQRLAKTWADGAPTHEIARHYARENKYAFYEEHVATPAKVIRFPKEADGFAGFKITEPSTTWTVYAGDHPILSKPRWGEQDGVFGARYHEIKVQNRFDNTENVRDPSIPGVMLRVHDDGLVYGKQYIPNCFRDLRLEMNKESSVRFYCFVLGSEEDQKILKGPSEIEIGQYDHNDKIRIK
jgi:hypothetical protein